MTRGADKTNSPWRFFDMHRIRLQVCLIVSIIGALGGDLLFGQHLTPSANSSAAGQSPGGPVRRILGPDSPPAPFPEASAIPQPTNDQELAAAINRLAHDLAAVDRFSGSILLSVDGKPLVDGAWGNADRATKTANTTDTAYDIGSIGKLITQVAILQLADAGKLSLEDTIAKHLPDYPNKEVAGKVTVRQLLLHQSGIADLFSRITPDTKFDTMVELKDFLPLFAGKPLEFEPGSTTHYSSSGYIVLGLIVEAVSGQKYSEYVNEHILKVAGMDHSGFFDRTHLPASVAHSYEGQQDVTAMHPRKGTSAGGMQASTRDLFRLVEAINSAKLIKPESIPVLRSFLPRPPTAPAPADATKLMAYGIEGGAPGVSAQLVIDPTGRYTRVILCNASPPMAMSMGATIREWINKMPAARK